MQKNKLVKLGRFVNTHGIKGEIRLLSTFDYKDELKVGRKIFISDNEFIIKSTRKHKNFILLTFEGIGNINDIEYLKGNDIYGVKISKKKEIPEYLGYEIYLKDKKVGKVIDYLKQGSIWSLVIRLEDNKITNIPFVLKEFIDKIEEDKIFIKDRGLI